MRRLFIALAVAAGFWSAPAFSQTIAQHSCNASFDALSAADKNKVAYGSFTTGCEETRRNWSAPPAFHADPSLSHVTGLCADNTYTTSLIRASACANEGGVVAWFFGNYAPPEPQAPAVTAPAISEPRREPAAPPPKPAPPSAKPPTTPVTSAIS